MNPKIAPINKKESLREDGMLFVRTDGILDTMLKVPLLVASMVVVASMMPIQSSSGSPRVMDLIIYPDGTTHVSVEIGVDPLVTDYELELYGSSIDNFVAVGEDEFLLESEVVGDSALIETFGSSVISVQYDIHDLVSKQGRIWTFSLDTSSDFTLLLPKNSAIITMTNIPINMEIASDQNRLTLSGGNTEIDYLFSTISDSPAINPTPLPAADPNYPIYGIVAAAGIAVAASVVLVAKRKQNEKAKEIKAIQTPSAQTTDLETIFKSRPDIREDDKELVKFISDNGGKVLESDLRKKFLQPRTTMWRAVKRLERHGIIEIEKKDMQNLVKLCKDVEE